MRPYHFLIMAILLLTSCAHYSTAYAEKETDYKLAIQRLYEPCVGYAGHRIVYDNQRGIQTTLAISCMDELLNVSACGYPGRVVTKEVSTYKRSKVIAKTVYKPVFDTTKLKNFYPEFFARFCDSTVSANQIIPLTTLDSTLIQKSIGYKEDTICNRKHLKYIIGFVLVSSNNMDYKIKKVTDFKTPKK